MKGLRYFTPININGEYCTGSCVLQLNPSKVITDEKGGKQDKKKKKKRPRQAKKIKCHGKDGEDDGEQIGRE